MRRARIGFLGVGWIGRNRMEAMLATGAVEAAAICDPSPEMTAEALALAPTAVPVASLGEMLENGVDGVVIATPSALHADQAVHALERGAAVFCQKPLGRNAAEVERVLAAAQAADRLLLVDFSYRFTAAMQQVRALVASGELGRIHAVDLVFHNAYGPDKAWFYDRSLSGGGCVMDLGVHLVDLALWTLGFPRVVSVSADLSEAGDGSDDMAVEDYAVATLNLEDGVIVRLACSWRLHAGRDAVIGAAFYGTEGGAAFRNVQGSFYDFRGEQYRGTQSITLVEPPDHWGGKAAAEWARRLSQGEGFAPEAARFVDVAGVVDRIYAHRERRRISPLR